jgi:hypothetical protein
MIEAVEYVVRLSPIGTKWVVYMVELDAQPPVPQFRGSHFVSEHRTMEAADRKAAKLRERDEAHISKVTGSRGKISFDLR